MAVSGDCTAGLRNCRADRFVAGPAILQLFHCGVNSGFTYSCPGVFINGAGKFFSHPGKSAALCGAVALVGGIFSTGPIYSWYMLLSELKQQGMKQSLMAAFLYSRAIKLPLLPLLIHYFGLTYTLILSLYLLVLSIASGIMTAILAGDKTH